MYNPQPRGSNLQHMQNPKGCTKEPHVASGSQGGIHSAFSTHTDYWDLVLTIGTSCLHWGHNLCLSPQHTGSPERLGTGSHSSSDPFTVPLAWCLVHSRCSVSYKAASAGGKRKILVQGPMVPLWVCFPHVQTGITSSVLTQPERINQESTCGKHQSIR